MVSNLQCRDDFQRSNELGAETQKKKNKSEEVTGLGWSNQFSLNLDTGKQVTIKSSLSRGD